MVVTLGVLKRECARLVDFVVKGYARKVRWFSVGTYHGTQNNLWHDLFKNPSEWRDTRLGKSSARHPDFKHMTSGKALWLDNQKKPSWVDSQLDILSSQLRRGLSVLQPGPGDEVQSLCNEGQLEKAVEALTYMDQQGKVPSVELYRSLLKASAKKKVLALARHVHAHLAKHGLESTKSLGEYVVNTLVKCGDLDEAVKLFSRLPHRTAFSWTAVISGYTKARQGTEALRLYKCMQSESVEPNKYTFVCLVEACGIIGDLKQGSQMHAEASKYGCESDLAVGTCLVDMYAKCGSILDARAVFDGLSERDVVTWTVLLGAYVGQGQADTALDLYLLLQEEGVCPDARTFVTLLQACSSLACKENSVPINGSPLDVQTLQTGKEFHVEVWRSGCGSNAFVGNALITMYGKCGSIVDAQNVFNGLSEPNRVSWNAMLAACAQQGEAEMALKFYAQMSEQGVSPDALTCASVLQACSSLADLDDSVRVGRQALKLEPLQKGKACHAEAHKKGYQANVFVGSALVSMYARCGSLMDAEQVFDRSSQRDVVSWNAMLAAFTQQGQGEQALQLYSQMQEDGGSLDARTFATAIQACGILADQEDTIPLFDEHFFGVEALQKGRAMHAEVAMSCNELDVYVGNALVSMYGKCGSVKDARTVFERLFERDVVSWNAMLTAYVQQDQVGSAVELYYELQEAGDNLDARIFVTMLQACCRSAGNEAAVFVDEHALKVGTLQKGKVLHAEVQRLGYDADVSVCNTLISTYGKCGCIGSARDVFQTVPQWDVGSWNAMLAVYAQEQLAVEALQLYGQMPEEGVSPNVWTFVTMLQACCYLAKKETGMQVLGGSVNFEFLQKGKAMHAEASRMGYNLDLRVASALVIMYGTCGSIDEAKMLFDHLSKERDIVLWNAMLTVHVEHGQAQKVLQLYRQMQEECVSPDETTYKCILQACSSIGALDTCIQIHRDLVSSGSHLNLLVGNILLDALGKSGSMKDALDVFEALPLPDLISWNALIAGFARQGNWETSLQTFHKMQVAGVKPDGVTFLSLLTACSHSGSVETGVEWFQSMSIEYGITPQIQHYATIVDLLGRAGHFTIVEDLMSQMPMEPDASMWRCLLGACQKHGNLALGKRAFDCAISLDPTHAAAYTLMSNIYKHAGMWDDATKLHEVRQEAGAWKYPGQTWIEHEQEMHTFMVGDQNHKHQKPINYLLKDFELRQVLLASS